MTSLARLALIVALALFTTCCALSPLGSNDKTQPFLGEYDYAMTAVLGEKVICAEARRESCGISLWDCSDKMRYECVTDVLIVDMRKVRRLPPKGGKDI